MKVFSGNANMSLAKDVCRLIGIQVGNAEIGHFSDGEVFASIYESGMSLVTVVPAAM